MIITARKNLCVYDSASLPILNNYVSALKSEEAVILHKETHVLLMLLCHGMLHVMLLFLCRGML